MVIHKRYEIEYGWLRVYDVVKESEQMFTFQTTFRGNVDERRRQKAGTFLTLREALQNRADSLTQSVAHRESDLDRMRKELASYKNVLGRSDEQIEQAASEILK